MTKTCHIILTIKSYCFTIYRITVYLEKYVFFASCKIYAKSYLRLGRQKIIKYIFLNSEKPHSPLCGIN